MKSTQGYNIECKTALSAYNYLFNGKELQQEIGWEVYDFHTRFYDQVIGRFMTQDPMSESMNAWSPYSFTFNNPIRFNDPTGMVPDEFYFAKNKKDLIGYKDTDGPDRVFIAKSDEQLGDNLENPLDKSLYNEVEMTDKQIQIRMDRNGYKKVPGKVLREERSTSSDSPQRGGTIEASSTSITEVVEDYKYVEKPNVEIDSKIIGDPIVDNTSNPYHSEYVTRRKLIYGKQSFGSKAVDILIKINNVRSGNYNIPTTRPVRYPNYESVTGTKEYLKKYKR